MKALAEGRPPACQCGADNCPNRTDDAVQSTRMVINVVAGQQTVFGNGHLPGHIEGYGVIASEQVRALARDVSGRCPSA